MEVAEVGAPLVVGYIGCFLCNWIPSGCHTIFGFEVSCIHAKS